MKIHGVVTACLPLILAALTLPRAFAQAGPGADQQPSAAELLKKIDELTAAQKDLSKQVEKLTAAQSAIAPLEDATDASSGNHQLGPVEFRGFSDFDFGRAWFEKLPPGGLHGTPQSFNIGDFDLFTNTRLSEHWSLLGELLISSDFSNEFGAEMDRLMVTYRANDYLKISVGKYATAIGYYTNAFHRAQYFQTGIGRPIMFSDEDNGGILPTHSIGVSATGKIPSGGLGLNWVGEVANGRQVDPSRPPIQNFVDENNGKAVNFALFARPEKLHGFQTGFSIYRDRLHPVATAAIGQTIFSAHAVYVGSKFEWLNEVALVRHAVTNQVFRSTTMYSQISRGFGNTRPYLRFDYQNVPAADPVFGTLGRVAAPSFGVNQRLSNYVALKLQYGRLGLRSLPSTNAFTAQLALAF